MNGLERRKCWCGMLTGMWFEMILSWSLWVEFEENTQENSLFEECFEVFAVWKSLC